MSADDPVMTAKTVAMCVLFTASMSLGSLPILLARCLKWDSDAKNNIYVKLLLCFGGGVLLCTTFLHLLPEVGERINELDYIPESDLHYAELLMCVGFFTMYFVEECVHFYLHKRQESSKSDYEKKSLESPVIMCDQDKKSDHNHDHDHSHFGGEVEDTAIKTIRGLLIVLALSVHELFEGLAVGLETSSSKVWYMFGAVSAHKLVIAFCIGIELVTSGMRVYLVVIYVFTFAIVSPMGIGVGMLISKNGEGSTKLPSVVLQGLASGTLLYVVFFEILRTERKGGLRQFFAVFLGFFIMLGLTFMQ